MSYSLRQVLSDPSRTIRDLASLSGRQDSQARWIQQISLEDVQNQPYLTMGMKVPEIRIAIPTERKSRRDEEKIHFIDVGGKGVRGSLPT